MICYLYLYIYLYSTILSILRANSEEYKIFLLFLINYFELIIMNCEDVSPELNNEILLKIRKQCELTFEKAGKKYITRSYIFKKDFPMFHQNCLLINKSIRPFLIFLVEIIKSNLDININYNILELYRKLFIEYSFLVDICSKENNLFTILHHFLKEIMSVVVYGKCLSENCFSKINKQYEFSNLNGDFYKRLKEFENEIINNSGVIISPIFFGFMIQHLENTYLNKTTQALTSQAPTQALTSQAPTQNEISEALNLLIYDSDYDNYNDSDYDNYNDSDYDNYD